MFQRNEKFTIFKEHNSPQRCHTSTCHLLGTFTGWASLHFIMQAANLRLPKFTFLLIGVINKPCVI